MKVISKMGSNNAKYSSAIETYPEEELKATQEDVINRLNRMKALLLEIQDIRNVFPSQTDMTGVACYYVRFG